MEESGEIGDIRVVPSGNEVYPQEPDSAGEVQWEEVCVCVPSCVVPFSVRVSGMSVDIGECWQRLARIVSLSRSAAIVSLF